MFNKKSNARRRRPAGPPRKPVWLVGRGALVMASLFFAAFTVVFWGLSLVEASPALAVFVSAGFAVSALVTPSVVPKLFHAQGFTLAGLLFTVVAFGAVDSAGLTLGFKGLEKQMTGPAYDAAVDAYQAAVKPYQTARAAAEAKRDAVVLVKTFPNGEPFGPQRMAEAQAAFELERSAHQKVIDENEAKIAAVPAPVRERIFDMTMIALLSTGLQIALALGMVALEAAREGVHAKALADYQAERDAVKAERERKAKAKAKAEAVAAKAAAEIAKARAKNGLKLAVDNEA